MLRYEVYYYLQKSLIYIIFTEGLLCAWLAMQFANGSHAFACLIALLFASGSGSVRALSTNFVSCT